VTAFTAKGHAPNETNTRKESARNSPLDVVRTQNLYRSRSKNLNDAMKESAWATWSNLFWLQKERGEVLSKNRRTLSHLIKSRQQRDGTEKRGKQRI
jgi:hypothetical protein